MRGYKKGEQNMKRFVAIDSGKDATKVAEYFPEKGKIKKFNIPTRVSDGDFRDDAIEKSTVIVSIDGNCYKVGGGARGAGASLETNKQTDVHRICTLTALAYLASANEEDEFYVATGLPAKDWAVVSKRMDFKDYILPEGKMTFEIKPRSQDPVKKKTFTISNRFVFPESIGALFMDETLESTTEDTITGVIDIGNLNLNATLWRGTELLQDQSTTAEYGGAVLVQELSQELSAKVTYCDELIALKALAERTLPEGLGLTEEQVEASKKTIARVIKTHAEKVKRACRSRGWSLDVMRIIAIGGTSEAIAPELQEEFGKSLTVLSDATYCNALGYLRMMCARIPEVGIVIPLNMLDQTTAVSNGDDNKKSKGAKA